MTLAILLHHIDESVEFSDANVPRPDPILPWTAVFIGLSDTFDETIFDNIRAARGSCPCNRASKG